MYLGLPKYLIWSLLQKLMDGAAKFYHKDLYLRYAVALDKPLVLQLQN